MKRHMLLVPLDGSPLAEAALPYATTLAGVHGDGIELVSVVEELGGGEHAARLTRLAAAGLRARLHAVADRLRSQGLAVETALCHGNAAEQILIHAEKARVRAVVLTTRGLGGVDRLLIGSTADKVIRLAHCPVLAVRPDAAQAPPEHWLPGRILVPLDGSPEAEQALPRTWSLAAALSCEVVLARVQPWLGAQLAIYGSYMPDVARLDEEAAHAAADYLKDVRRAAPAEVCLRTVVLHGDPTERLLGLVAADGVGLVVMTSHGHNGLRRAVLGSVADRLVRHGVPVLIAHPVSVSVPEHDGRTPALATG